MSVAEPATSVATCRHCGQQIALRAFDVTTWVWLHVRDGRRECGRVAVDGL